MPTAKKPIPLDMNNPYVLGGVFGLAGLLAFFFFRQTDDGFKAAKIPKDKPWGANLTDQESQLIRQYTLRFYDDMSGWNWLGHDMALYDEFKDVPNKIFIGTYNDFTEKYMSEDEGTLREWIVNEGFTDISSPKVIIDKMAYLGLA